MAKKRKNFLLSESSMGLLGRMENASRYLDDLVQARQQRAMQSLIALQIAGWTGQEILAACEVLNGAMSFCVAPRLHGEILAGASGWDITPDRWAELAHHISESESVAYALHEVVSEYWCGNTALEEAIRRGK